MNKIITCIILVVFFGMHSKTCAEYKDGDILKFFDGVKISSFVANAPESLNITSYPQKKKISVIRAFDNRKNFAFWTDAYIENEDFLAFPTRSKEDWLSNISTLPGCFNFISYIEDKKLFIMGYFYDGYFYYFKIAKPLFLGRPALVLSKNLNTNWGWKKDLSGNFLSAQFKFTPPSEISEDNTLPNIIINSDGTFIYNKNTETFLEGYFSNSDAQFKDYNFDKKIIGELSDLLVYRSLYARFGKTEPTSPPNYLDISEILRMEESHKNGKLDNEKYLAATKPYRVYKDIMGNLLGEWKCASGSMSISTVSNYVYCMNRENSEIFDMTFVRFGALKKAIIRNDVFISIREEKDFIFGDAKMIVSTARIDQIANNAIYWQRGSEDFEKWEISDDFTEIKEYRKDGENWVLQSVMKKVIDQDKNKKTEK